ncbi:DNA polymerase subunit gamma-2, mitochondrial-like isoform X2 [Mya arenaria]|uniref:DNA polymerase subunit gamma-2, mitochondrial-like isoform X2 n=1 Tax=Mya arenaria TaxID=6604 RepID=UPI0022E101D4|nr:DNA polymerase subunit gamma-2, mitochondrial-like isoform X2 [Mya arenaria]
MMKAVPSLEKIAVLLSRCGYIQNDLGKAVYTCGPAGTLLRHNIHHTWWDKMVNRSEASFPVSGENISLLKDFYMPTLRLMNHSVPFSLTHISQSSPVQPVQGHEHIAALLNLHSETRMELVHFCSQTAVNQTFDVVVNSRISWWKQYSCNYANFTQKTEGEGGLQEVHLQYTSPWGPVTIETVKNRGQDEVSRLAEEIGQDCKVKNGKKMAIPYMIESVTSLELATALFLIDAFTERSSVNDNTVTRQVLQLHPALAPYKVCMCQDGSLTRQIQEVVTYVSRELRKAGLHVLDTRRDSGDVDAQIHRNDEFGVPFTVTVNNNTIKTGNIQLRNRDTSIQETVPIGKLAEYIAKHVFYQPT